MLEGKLENLTNRKVAAEEELKRQLKTSELVLDSERKKVAFAVSESQGLLKQAQDALVEAEKIRLGIGDHGRIEESKSKLKELADSAKKLASVK